MKLSEILEDVEVIELIDCDGDAEVSFVTNDSRSIIPGSVFVAILGERLDGHEFVDEAVGKGARAVVIERPIYPPPKCGIVRVVSTHRALGTLASNYFNCPSKTLRMIGVVGTKGKTSTTLFLQSILNAAGDRAAVIGSLGIGRMDALEPGDLTTPDPYRLQYILADLRNEGYTHAAMEVSSHGIKQARIAGTAFAAGVFTQMSWDHMDFHKTWEDYEDTKVSFFTDYLKSKDQIAAVNMDDQVGRRIIMATKAQALTFSLDDDAANLYASDVALHPTHTRFQLHTPIHGGAVKLHLPARFNVANALAASAAAIGLGVGLDPVIKGLESLKTVPGRMERVDEGQPFTVIVDYSHTPDALEKVLEALREFGHGRLITVMGCGGDRDKAKRPLMGKAAAEKSDVVVVTSDNPRMEDPLAIISEIVSGIRSVGVKTPDVPTDLESIAHSVGKPSVIITASRRHAIETAVNMAKAKDTILIAGKGHEDYQIIGTKKIHFDDREVAREVLAKLTGGRKEK